jgi:hypothetical protein
MIGSRVYVDHPNIDDVTSHGLLDAVDIQARMHPLWV